MSRLFFSGLTPKALAIILCLYYICPLQKLQVNVEKQANFYTKISMQHIRNSFNFYEILNCLVPSNLNNNYSSIKTKV
jgi:hypothetical protein